MISSLKRIAAASLLVFSFAQLLHADRVIQNFNKDWRFSLQADDSAAKPECNDSEWRVLNLPHDWAIEGDFDVHNPSGTGGGALPGGIGWYRKAFTVDSKDKGNLFSIEFDGVYMNSSVYINGQLLGTRPYGYISFSYDITPYIKWGQENVVSVKVDNSDQPNSRWYSGCGIYRNVRLVKTAQVRVAQWGTYVTTEVEKNGKARLGIETTVLGGSGKTEDVIVRTSLVDAKGKTMSSTESPLKVSQESKINQELTVADAHLWNLDDPYLYSIETEIIQNGKIIDTYSTSTGIRTIKFDAETGFYLNGQHVDINGVCNHHDLGCLGSAINVRALERQLEILKAMGCNGIRCSHNPPAPELLELCDKMGFVVMDEAFDMWRRRKTEKDYARFFDEWYERDLTDLIVRDRNHPSIVIWSIGNEVLEQWSDAQADTLTLEQANLILNAGHSADQLAKEGDKLSVNSLITIRLAEVVRSLDTTRPITSGCNEPSPGNHLFRSGALDVIGYNYHNMNIASVPRNFPGKPFIITESISGLMTRGFYQMPSSQQFIWPERWDKPFYNDSYSCSSYDNCHVPWGTYHEDNMLTLRKYPYVSGQFIWTGFDYIGEPTPYGWPARSSYFGIVDLAGFPKDVYYLYQSEWTDTPVLHLFPHWNWEPGQDIDMWCYYNNADEVELFINGKSQGVRSKDESHLHVVWNVKFEPGTVKVIARKDGKEVAQQEIRTAGEPAQIRLTADRKKIKANGTDLSYITVEILDKDGNLCPNAENLVNFQINGQAFIAGVDNGSPISLERFKDNKRKAFYGKCLVVLQNNGKKGKAKLTATSEGLKPASLKIKAAK